jgi:hypothetical protein
MAIGLTNFERKKTSTDEWERIGHIEWTSPLTGTVELGDEEVSGFAILSQFSFRPSTRLTSKICGGLRTARGVSCFVNPPKRAINNLLHSRSRRFKYKGIEYKWKVDKEDLYVSTFESSFTPRLIYALLLVCWSRGQCAGKMVPKTFYPSNFYPPGTSHRTSAHYMLIEPLVSI